MVNCVSIEHKYNTRSKTKVNIVPVEHKYDIKSNYNLFLNFRI
jgi:hypothetical protein